MIKSKLRNTSATNSLAYYRRVMPTSCVNLVMAVYHSAIILSEGNFSRRIITACVKVVRYLLWTFVFRSDFLSLISAHNRAFGTLEADFFMKIWVIYITGLMWIPSVSQASRRFSRHSEIAIVWNGSKLWCFILTVIRFAIFGAFIDTALSYLGEVSFTWNVR